MAQSRLAHTAGRGVIAASYLAALLILGGGGSPSPLTELACQVLAVAAVLATLVFDRQGVRAMPRPLIVLVMLVCLVPIVQLIPLPPILWHAMPGRQLLIDSLALVGEADRWQPWSIAPQRTLEAVLSLGPPLVALWLIARLDLSGRTQVIRTVAVLGAVALLVGAVQIASAGSSSLAFYGPSQENFLLGFHANHNATADVLLIAILALFAGWTDRASDSIGASTVVWLAGLVLILGVILTGSRVGMLLLAITLGWVAWGWLRRRPDRQSAMWIIVPILATLALAFAAAQSRTVGRAIARFELGSDYRFEIWRDTWHAIGEYWPLGSGLGTFTRAIGSAERLEGIGPVVPNRAHNEYLEVLLEGGLPLAICWIVVGTMIAVALFRAVRTVNDRNLGQTVFAGGTISVIALHSAIDYPFRSMALAALAAVAASLILAPAAHRTAERKPQTEPL